MVQGPFKNGGGGVFVVDPHLLDGTGQRDAIRGHCHDRAVDPAIDLHGHRHIKYLTELFERHDGLSLGSRLRHANAEKARDAHHDLLGEVTRREGGDVVEHGSELRRRSEKYETEGASLGGQSETRPVHAQDPRLAEQAQHKMLIRTSGRELDPRHHVKCGTGHH